MVAATRPIGQLNPKKEYELTATMKIGVETTGVETTGVEMTGVETNILRWNQVSICSVSFLLEFPVSSILTMIHVYFLLCYVYSRLEG